MEFKDLWDLESAMEVLSHKTVDGKVWVEAVEWLILYGPPEIRQLLLDASTLATNTSFPDLRPSHFTTDGQPCYDIRDLAKSLNILEEEVRKLLKEKDTAIQGMFITGSSGNETVH
ncbi:MAG: hypothetical protein OEL83_20795 [Desulforhopalus sp.]|nr:hypothetical protein [Desulforhopalus sp.]